MSFMDSNPEIVRCKQPKMAVKSKMVKQRHVCIHCNWRKDINKPKMAVKSKDGKKKIHLVSIATGGKTSTA